jgi:hypothetical protein
MSQLQTQPYNKAVLVTKSDTINQDGSLDSTLVGTVNRAIPWEALYVGGAGIVVIVLEDHTTQQFTAVAGQILPIKGIRVNSGTTSATLMEALYTV